MDEHHILCNGNPNSPIETCHWCNDLDLWKIFPYHMPWCICHECILAEYIKLWQEDPVKQPPLGQGFFVELDEESEIILRKNLWKLYE